MSGVTTTTTELQEPAAPPRRRIGRVAGAWLTVAAIIGGLLWWGIASGTCASTATGWTYLIVTGLTIGFIYALIALGYTMVYGVLQLINFAHSEVLMIGSFAGLYVISKIFGITADPTETGSSGVMIYVILIVSLGLAGLASAGTAVGIERVAYRPLRKRGVPRLNYLITAI